ncbi:chromosome segregation protein SMC [Corynebacterium kozikiae]|uniref:chromosome segregation protein SMC n=1 Tax=Corynebacterium kozikiae TaxID=2968469 RepID=UPI00211D0872|nr:chromosome segregation protein SMC [Corynebacterium sp. 76QC2CO]
MYLKSLTLKGFKSFASATTLKFEPGICAVVGPNGSGKSNVVDALAWVMGEQGAKTLRGGKMEDVIFAGAGERKPLGRAEVTLTIDNSDGALPIEYREVSVTRRMFRDGASEYEINGSRARLMDIQELLSDSGIGREMHVIVGQGRLAQILESRPEDRRAFIEEAAGVLKHRRRKEKAQRKLVGMQANLDRLTDLTEELRRQLKPLARQAEAAKRAATVQATLRDARLKVAGFELDDLEQQLAQANAALRTELEKLEELTGATEEALEVQVTLEEELEQCTAEAEAAQSLWFELSALAERVAATTRIAHDRARNSTAVPYSGADPDELDAKAEAAQEHLEELHEHVEVLQARLEAVSEQVEQCREQAQLADEEHLKAVRAIADRREGVVRLLAARETHSNAVVQAEQEIAHLQAAWAESEEAYQRAKQQLERATTELRQAQHAAAPLKEAAEQAQSEAEAAEARLEQLRASHVGLQQQVSRLESRIETLEVQAPKADLGNQPELELSPLAQLITVEPGYESALAAALGELANALVGELDAGVVDELAENVSRTAVVAPTAGEPWRMVQEDVRWLLDVVEVAPQIQAAVNRVLVDVVCAEDTQQARALVEADPRLRAVTKQGVLVGQGWVSFGSTVASGVEVASLVAQASTELEEVRAQLLEISGTLEGAKQAAAEARVAVAQTTATHREHTQAIGGLERELRRLEQQAQHGQAGQRKSAERLEQARTRLAAAQELLEDTADRLARVEEQPSAQEPSTLARDEAAAALRQASAMEMEAKLALRSAQDKAEQAKGRAEGLRRQAQSERQAKARHLAAMEHRMKQARLAQVVAEQSEAVGRRVASALERATAAKQETSARKQQVTSQLSTAKDRAKTLQAHLGSSKDTAHARQLRLGEVQTRREEVHAKITEQLGVPAQEVLRDYAPQGLFDVELERARLRQAEKDLNALGKVNPLALEEFKALEQRYEFLSTQLADVEQARRDLTDVITDVDAKILQLFTDAWHDVAAEFPKVFDTLFPGGEGKLVLTEPDSMLTTGIEVEARPPGKKVKRLSLLSGGEKSLTALAMLVAIFRARPSPFYVMDEVEAALDDVNLRRLIALFEQLREDSQLIVITHQKPTMDVANVLYGVTMRGDGVTRVISQRMTPKPN